MSYTILVANSKGGVGKTTTSVTVAHALTYLGQRVLLVDLDAQGHVALSLGIKRTPDVYDLLSKGVLNVRGTGRDRLYLVSSDGSTADAANSFAGKLFSLFYLRKSLEPARAEFDAIIIDTPPGVTPLTAAALMAATHVLIPVACDELSLDGLTEYTGALAEAQGAGASCVLGWVFPTLYDRVTNATHSAYVRVLEMYPDLTVAPIPRQTAMRDAAEQHQTIWEFAPKSRVACAYGNLVKKMARDLGVG